MAIGRVGSFATDTPLNKNYVGEALSETENQGFRYRKERRDIAEAKKKEEEDKNKAVELEFDSFDKSLVPTITGYSSIDDPVNMYAMDVKQKGVDWIREKNQTTDPYKKAEIQSKINKATQSFKMLNQYPKLLNEKKAELEEGIKAGKYNERDLGAVTEMAKSLDSGKYDMRVDENGVPRMTIYKVDENGTPVGILEKGISLGDLTNRITPFQKPTYDINGGIAEQITSQIKLDESKVQNGFVTTTVEQRDKRVNDALKSKAEEVATMPSEAYELWQKMGNSPKRNFTEADKKQISEYVYEDLKSRYRNKYEKDIDQGDALNARKFAKQLKDEEVMISDASIVTSTPEAPYKLDAKDKNGKDIVLQNGTKDFPIGNAIIKTGEGKQKKITNVYVSPGGKMRVRIEETGFEGTNKSKKELSPEGKRKEKFNKDNATKIANKQIQAEKIFEDDYINVSESDKKPVVRVLDFKDVKEIGPLALKMNYKSAKAMQDDFINRSGGDEFIVTPDERNQPKAKTEPKKTISRADIASKAKAAGYTPQEYEKLLKQNGVTIK
jgi:DNA-binding transcriptional regulator YhcF (GntR family)